MRISMRKILKRFDTFLTEILKVKGAKVFYLYCEDITSRHYKNYMSLKNLVFSYKLAANQIPGFFKLLYIKNHVIYKTDFLHAVRHPLKLQFNRAIFVICSQTCPGMPRVL